MKRRYLGLARTGAIVVVGVCIVVLAYTASMRSASSMILIPPTPDELAVALHRCGLDPEPLAAAGVSAAATGTLVESMSTYLAEHPGEMDLVDGSFGEVKREHDQLLRRARSGRASPRKIEALGTARTGLASAQAQRESMVSDLFAAATEDLTAQQRATLTQIQSNRHWKLPVEFLVLSQTEAQWVALRTALGNEQVAERYDEEPDAGHQAVLEQIRGLPAVSTAQANLDTGIDLVTFAWEDAVGF